MIRIIFPGFGKPRITIETLRLQPWNYLVQIAEDLARQGYKVELEPWHGKLGERSKRVLADMGISVGEASIDCGAEALLIPLGFGYARKWARKLRDNRRGCRLIGVLTTFLTSLSGLFRNYVRIKLTRTSISANAVLAENILARLLGKRLMKLFDLIITPSKDYAKYITNPDIFVYYPKIDVATAFKANPGTRKEKDDTVTLLYFGPYTEERGVVSIIKSFKKIKENVSTPIKLSLLLREGVPTSFQAMREVEIIAGRIAREELWERILSSDIVLLPYRIIPSTVPLSFFESLFAEGPLVLASWIPGFREHVSNYLPEALPENYSFRDLADYMVRIITADRRKILHKQYKYSIKLREKIINQKIKL